MKQEWQTTTIGKQIKLQRGHDITKKEQKKGNIPVVSSSGVNSYHDTAKAKGPGVVIGRKGSLGTVYYLSEDYWPHDTTLYVVDFKDNYPLFVYYFLLSMAKRFYSMDNATANPALNRNHVHPIQVLWPPIHDQKAIASILGSLDDKIELNNKMNETLETMARALYKSWFVDFDPVVAKTAGKRPFGMEDETAALFPDRFVDSELGPIPEGWDVKPISEMADFINGRNFTKNASGTGKMVIRIAELNRGPSGSTVYNDIEAEEKNIANPGDILFAWSGSLDVYRWYREQALINQHIFKVIPKDHPNWFIHQALEDSIDFFRTIAEGKATTMGHIKRSHLNEAFVVTPSPSVLSAADEIFAPINSQWLSNHKETQTLSRLRDLLLPKLISGEIRIKDAEKVVEEVL